MPPEVARPRAYRPVGAKMTRFTWLSLFFSGLIICEIEGEETFLETLFLHYLARDCYIYHYWPYSFLAVYLIVCSISNLFFDYLIQLKGMETVVKKMTPIVN